MITLPAFKESFAALVAAPTVSSIDPAYDQSNAPAVDLLANWFADLGFRIEIMPVDKSAGKVNLIASLGSGSGGLVLSGHTDTVPFTEAAWRQDPFRLTEKDGRYYGLGVTDMKCFFPIIMQALQALDLKKIKRPLLLLATCDEESTMAGARALVDMDRGFGRYALIGEPTGLQPINMHKGGFTEAITLKGQAGHASDPSLGNNAIEGMHQVIAALFSWREHLQDAYVNDRFNVATPTLNFGVIRGGDNPNRICAECELKVDIRILPGMSIDDMRKRLRLTVSDAVADSGLELAFGRSFAGIAPFQTDPDSEIVKVAEKLTGHAVGSVNFGTEGPFLNSMGMDTVVLGPGDIDQAHQANEYIEQSRIPVMQRVLQQVITHFCM